MLYKINKNILFRDDDGCIWIENNESFRYDLTATTSRLLSFLLQNQGEILTRDKILIQVWDKYGLTSSNNSLNKYISDLRQIIKSLGLDEEIIITLPRIGFKIPEHISIEIIKSSQKYELNMIDIKNNDTTYSENQNKTKKKKIISLCSVIITATIAFFATMFFLFQNNQSQLDKNFLLTQLNGCDVLTFTEVPREMKVGIANIAKDFISNKNIKCNADSIIYFQVTEPVLYGKDGSVFIAHCYFNRTSGELLTCQNIYNDDYVNK
ncbi:hypothetical protein GJ686_24730 [Klebsiella variicola]|uniref:winged helix-turn-helix domain-containing protein n=1 Tax=Klebsiella variicola TaxID=244366 RepID=UPI0012DC0085|nr:helix-turn-helix domain-containing protein [Klebsiella variicola]MUM52690.1 hypothetical protein [Klebsiella variicola]MUM57771.1 hypothetical protein [Klebsiella variicola]